MNEYPLQFIASGKLFWSGVFCLLYGLGGIERKWIRRYLGPLWMGLGLWMFASLQGTFNAWGLLYAPLLSLSLHLGYGGESTGVKVRKRLLYGLAIAVSALPLAVISGLWLLYGIHVAICVSMSVLLGVFNPTDSARSEETLIACFTSVLPLFLIA